MDTHKLAAEVAKTNPKLAFEIVLGTDEPAPIGVGEPLPEDAKVSLVNTRDLLRTALLAMNQGNYPNMVKALGNLVINVGTVIHSFSDLEPEAALLQKAGLKLRKSKGEVKRVKTAEDKDDEDKDEDKKGKPFPGAAPPFGKKDE